MAFTGNTGNEPDAATLALWRAAEAGELDEIEAMLPQVTDLNARNEHGVTALMRAAQHGHARVVRLLLANGADANIIRNDKFTALSLAAFFGYTDVVRALMDHGADSKASTRHGTSAHMWATARTFNEVVDQLKKPAPPVREERPATGRPTPAPPASLARPVPEIPQVGRVVRTLKDPPEIWDLVHEVPRGFDARSAFMARLRSMKLTLRLATAAGLVGACVVGALVLRGVHARSEVTTERQLKPPPAAVKVQNETKTLGNHSVQPALTVPAAAPSGFVAPPVSTVPDDFRTTPARRRSSHARVVSSPGVELNPTERPAASESVQRIATPTEKTDVKMRPDSTPQTKTSSPLSPQLITPAKSVSPKAKVIQWP